MKKIFYLLFLLFTAFSLSAQNPAGVTGSVLWLKGNAGASVTAWTDNSGSGNDFLPPAPANQPLFIGNVFNFNSALKFDGANSYLTKLLPNNLPENSDDRTIFAVANATATDMFNWIFVYGSPGTMGATCQVGNNSSGAFTAGLADAFYALDITSNNYWNAAINANGALNAFKLSTSAGVTTGTQYDRGNLLQSAPLTGLSATSVHGIVGALDENGTQAWAGNIGEIIVFNSALTDPQRNKVESYLALKYGFTLGSTSSLLNYVSSGSVTYWTANATYQNDVFGIGTDAGSALTQSQSNSMNSGNGDGTGQSAKGNLILSTGTALTDGQFLMIGNDAGDLLTEHTIASGEAPANAVGSQRVSRNWQAQNTNTVGPVNLSFDITGLTYTGGTTASNYRLMIDEDGNGNYNDGIQTFVVPVSLTGNQLNFNGVTLNNNAVFTIITQGSVLLLPAIWQGFNVALQKNAATLTWKTSDEVNVDHYSVEYSADGISFTFAGNVPAKNNAGINTYTFVQDNLPIGVRYFHIKQVDKDGKFLISDVKSVHVGGVNSVLLKSNPIRIGKLELNIDVQQNQDAIIRIISTSGKILLQKQTGLSTGTNSVSTNISGMAAGSYFLQVQLGTEIINKKFVKL